MGNERMQILKMIEEGTVSAEEGMKLIEALDEPQVTETISGRKPKMLRVKVNEPGKNNRVNIKIPLSLINVGLKIGKKFSPELQESMDGIDMDEIMQMIKEGAEGKLVDVETEDGETVEIFVE